MSKFPILHIVHMNVVDTRAPNSQTFLKMISPSEINQQLNPRLVSSSAQLLSSDL